MCVFSLPEHEVPKVSYCDHPVSVVRRASVGRPSWTISLNDISS